MIIFFRRSFNFKESNTKCLFAINRIDFIKFIKLKAFFLHVWNKLPWNSNTLTFRDINDFFICHDSPLVELANPSWLLSSWNNNRDSVCPNITNIIIESVLFFVQSISCFFTFDSMNILINVSLYISTVYYPIFWITFFSIISSLEDVTSYQEWFLEWIN